MQANWLATGREHPGQVFVANTSKSISIVCLE
jgi:hypothetical protein